MNLYKLKISGTPISDVVGYTSDQLSGNSIYVGAATNPSSNDYDDISSIENWVEYGDKVLNDYMAIRSEIMDIICDIPWSGLTNDEKDLTIDYHAYHDGVCVKHKVGSFDDLRVKTVFVGTANTSYSVIIDSTGATDTFKWSKDGGAYTTGTTISGSSYHTLDADLDIFFLNSSGHSVNDEWHLECRVGTDTDKVVHLITTKGYSQAQAQGYLLSIWHKHFQNMIKSCNGRWLIAIKETLKYLTKADAADLFDTVDVLAEKLLRTARLGKNFGDSADGIMDYIDSTNIFFEQGLEENGYTLQAGTWTDLKTALHDVLVKGIYDKNDLI